MSSETIGLATIAEVDRGSLFSGCHQVLLLLLLPQQRLEPLWCLEICVREGRRYGKFLDFVVVMPLPPLLVLLACLAVS